MNELFAEEAIDIINDMHTERLDYETEYLPLINAALALQEYENIAPNGIVQCKDCIHYYEGVCLKIYDDGAADKSAWQKRNPDDFCNYGKKAEKK